MERNIYKEMADAWDNYCSGRCGDYEKGTYARTYEDYYNEEITNEKLAQYLEDIFNKKFFKNSKSLKSNLIDLLKDIKTKTNFEKEIKNIFESFKYNYGTKNVKVLAEKIIVSNGSEKILLFNFCDCDCSECLCELANIYNKELCTEIERG
jgi:hypothetical protein